MNLFPLKGFFHCLHKKDWIFIACLAFPITSPAVDHLVNGDTFLTIEAGAILDGTDATPSSAFATEILTIGNETVISDALQLTTVPLITIGGLDYFTFIYDAQETKKGQELQITELFLYVDTVDTGLNTSTAILVWELDSLNNIKVNPGGGSPATDSPLGAGGDMAMYVPVELFAGLNSNDYLYFQTTQTGSDNGSDEWVLTGTQFLDPGTTIVPEPGSAILVLCGGICFLLVRKQRQIAGSVGRS